MSKNEAIKFIFVRTLGNFLLLFSLYGVLATFGPIMYYELQFQVAQFRGVTFVVHSQTKSGTNIQQAAPQSVSQEPTFADILAGSKEQVLVPKDTQFSIVIPKIGASAKVFPNVDPSDPDIYKPILLQGVAHAKGSVFPGMIGNIYLFAHSTDNFWDVGRYNAVFYLLKDLKKGDSITIFFENVRYEYIVDQTLITDPGDISLLFGQDKKEQLVLQTCWPPGTTLKRLFVIAVPKKDVN